MLIAAMICGNGEVAELGLMRRTANALREETPFEGSNPSLSANDIGKR